MLTTEREFPAPVVYGASISLKKIRWFLDWVMPSNDVLTYETIKTYLLEDYSDGRREMFLFSPEKGEDIATFDVLDELDDLGFRAANFDELMAFIANYPEEPLLYSIAALGCIGTFGQMLVVPVLTWNKSRGKGLIPLPATTRWNSSSHRLLVLPR